MAYSVYVLFFWGTFVKKKKQKKKQYRLKVQAALKSCENTDFSKNITVATDLIFFFHHGQFYS